jgi:uncharacterized protein YjdB
MLKPYRSKNMDRTKKVVSLVVFFFLSLLFTMNMYALADDPPPTAFLSLSNIPSGVDTIKIAVKSITGQTDVIIQSVSAGGTAQIPLYLPEKNTYRLRIIGYKAEGTFPGVVAGADVKSVTINPGEVSQIDAAMELVQAQLDESVPQQAYMGDVVHVKINIYDPANFLEGISNNRIWWNEGDGEQQIGTNLTKISDKNYQINKDMTMPLNQCNITYRYGENNGSFTSPSNAPFLYSSYFNLQVIPSPPTAYLNLANIPSTIDTIKIAVKNTAGQTEVIKQSISTGGTAQIPLNLLANNTYRLRIIGYKAEGTFPGVVAGADVKSVTINPGEVSQIDAAMELVQTQLDSSVPFQSRLGNVIDIKINIYDPANFLEGVSNNRIWWDEGNGEQQSGGILSKLSDCNYQITLSKTPLHPCHVKFRYGENNSTFSSPNDAPFLYSNYYELYAGTVVKIQNNIATVDTGYTDVLVATVHSAEGDNIDVIWSSEDSSVASIDQNGSIRALKPGLTIVSATAQDGTGEKGE